MPLHGYTTPNTCIIHSAVYSLCVYCVYYYILMSFFMDLHMILTDQLFRRDIEIHSGVCRCWPHREEWNLVFCKRCHQMEAGLFFSRLFFFVGHTGHCGCFHFFFPFWRCLRRWADGLWHSETWRWHGQHRDPYLGAEMDGFNQGHEMDGNPLEMIWCGGIFFSLLTIPIQFHTVHSFSHHQFFQVNFLGFPF